MGEFAKGENVTVFAGKVGPTSSAKEAFRYPPSPPPSVTLFLACCSVPAAVADTAQQYSYGERKGGRVAVHG